MLKYLAMSLGLAALIVLAGDIRASADIFGKDDRVPVTELDGKDPLRALSKPFGVLVVTLKKTDDIPGRTGRRDLVLEGCTAVVISPTHVLTTAFCGGLSNWDGWNTKEISVQLRLGIDQADRGTKSFDLKLPPFEVNEKLNFAVLQVEGNPAIEFGTAQLLVRNPIPGEKLIVFQSGQKGELLVQSEDCTIPKEVPPVRETLEEFKLRSFHVLHTCDTLVASSGALLLSTTDRAVLGLGAYGGSWRGVYGANIAIAMQAIVEASPPIAAVAWLKNTPQAIGSGGAKRFTVSIQDEAFSQIRTGSTIKINGKAHRVADVLSEGRRVTYLGEQSDLLRGRNEIEIESIKLHVWNAEHVLNRFEHPYKKSHAIIAAIDAYDEAVDPRVRSNFQKLEGMVARADELRSTLVNLGFPKENIIWLPNGEATRKNIDDALSLFWEGGRHMDADRLVFYFGGHGGGIERKGYLVTLDMEYRRPTWTAFPMSDFSGRHFPNINAHHFLVLLDSCSSGLAVQTMQTLDEELDEARLERFANLVTIGANVKDPARQLFVASTGEQRALWETGGIFTRALIDGLKGKADLFDDGIITLHELKLYIQRQVEPRALQAGVVQRPRLSTADAFGEGRMLFLLPQR